MQRIVWDWNGTLFDDLHIVVEAVNAGIEPWGIGPITLDDYRLHYTRPVKLFYDRLLGHETTEEEWLELDRRFHDGYRLLLTQASLNRDAELLLQEAARLGVRQSLLSMFPHDELVPLVKRLGIERFFDRIDGLVGSPGDRKAAYLEAHLEVLLEGARPSSVLVVGDTPDDAVAAAHVGARCILYDNGSHHTEELAATGAEVVSSLTEILPILASAERI